jgi:hypothetical protein
MTWSSYFPTSFFILVFNPILASSLSEKVAHVINTRYVRKTFETASNLCGPLILVIIILSGMDTNSTIALLVVETARAIIDSLKTLRLGSDGTDNASD